MEPNGSLLFIHFIYSFDCCQVPLNYIGPFFFALFSFSSLWDRLKAERLLENTPLILFSLKMMRIARTRYYTNVVLSA